MKKKLLFVFILSAGILLASCGNQETGQDIGSDQDRTVGAYQFSAEQGGEGGAGTGSGDQSGEGKPGDDLAGVEASPSGKGDGEAEESWEEEEAFLSDQILHIGETLQVMYYKDENTLCPELEFTLQKAGLYDSMEAAGLGNVEHEEEAEVYDKDGNPEECSIAGMRILSCDLTARNIDAVGGSDQHISTIMLAYADPATQKVTMVSCMPVYFSASSSNVDSGEYYHYQLSQGESRDMTVAWAVPDEYEAENLYLCVTYDNRNPQDRQYIKLVD